MLVLSFGSACILLFSFKGATQLLSFLKDLIKGRTSGLPGAVYDVRLNLKLTFCLLNNGGCAPTPLLPFRVRAVKSFVGHIVTIFSDYNMIETPKQQIE